MNDVRGKCVYCEKSGRVCFQCHRCSTHCSCPSFLTEFDADELGLDPETDNDPEDPSRHA